MSRESVKEQKLDLIIIVFGNPEQKSYPANMKVEEVMKSLLPSSEKQNWNQYQLSDRSGKLDPTKSLEDDGVKNGDTLTLTKAPGGGGHCSKCNCRSPISKIAL
jgi:hypothetical protein